MLRICLLYLYNESYEINIPTEDLEDWNEDDTVEVDDIENKSSDIKSADNKIFPLPVLNSLLNIRNDIHTNLCVWLNQCTGIVWCLIQRIVSFKTVHQRTMCSFDYFEIFFIIYIGFTFNSVFDYYEKEGPKLIFKA